MHLWKHVQFSLCSLLAAYQYHLQVQGFCEESTYRYCTETLLLFGGEGGEFLRKKHYIFYSYIDIYVFSGHGVNHGSCDVNIITISHHLPSQLEK